MGIHETQILRLARSVDAVPPSRNEQKGQIRKSPSHASRPLQVKRDARRPL